MVVVLPAPLAPRKPKTSPRGDLERQPVEGRRRAEALGDVIDVEAHAAEDSPGSSATHPLPLSQCNRCPVRPPSSRSSPNGVRSSRDANGPRLHPCGPRRRPPRDRLGRRPRDRLRHDDAALALSVRILPRRGRDARLARQRPDADRRADPAGRRRDGRRLRHRPDLGGRPSHGYYTFTLLRDRCPCPTCTARRAAAVPAAPGETIGSTRHEEHA